MKKTLCLMLCVIMALGFSACNKTEKEEKEQASSSANTQETKEFIKNGVIAEKIKITVIDDDNTLWLEEAHFEKISLKKTENDDFYLEIITTKDGKKALENTTTQNINKTLSFIVDDTLLFFFTVKNPIKNGILTYEGKSVDPVYAFNLLTDASDKTEGLIPPKNLISEEEAKTIAFEKANTSAENVQNLEVNLEFNEKWRGWEYDIEFNIGNKKYECVINAIYGTIIKFIS